MSTTPVASDGWSFDKVLGTGGFGIVQLWIHTQSGKQLAIKKCKWDSGQLTETQQKRWANEVQIMKRLQHPNIVKSINLPFKLSVDDINLPILCMEYCRNGDLRRVLNKAENCYGVTETEAINVMKAVSSAVEYLHSHSITHRDLKPENIVLQDETDGISYKLIDLGYAKELGEASASASIVGTLNYVAPELLWNQKYSCSVDYWSLGILFYELLTGIRPFLPNMQHTMIWMQHIKNKSYNDICAYESEGKIIFGTDIEDPTQISKCLRERLAEWFRIVLQWDPKKRGKLIDENGKSQLVVFNLLNSILSKKIIYIFFISLYTIGAYEVSVSTTLAELQELIEKDYGVPVNQQILTDYFGKILCGNESPFVFKINDHVLFLFKTGCTLIKSIPTINLPTAIQKMIEKSKSVLDFEELKRYYRTAIFFIKQETQLFKLYIFALTIKVDLVVARVNMFNENVTNTLAHTKMLLNELNTIREKWEKEGANTDTRKALEVNFGKVSKLFHAAQQIKIKFSPLIEESKELRNKAQSIDCFKTVTEPYDKSLMVFETLRKEHYPKGGRPTPMVKVMFEFLQVREVQLSNAHISEITQQIVKLEVELLTLERIFDSVTAMSIVYREQLQNIMQYSNKPIAVANEAVEQTAMELDAMEISSDLSSSQSSSMSVAGCKESDNKDEDVVYDNLVIRYTLDNLLIKMQKKYLEIVSLEP